MGRPYNQRGIYGDQEYGADNGLGAEPKIQRRQEPSNRSRSHDDKSPKIGPNLIRFAYDRINGHNPWQRLMKFNGTYARMTAIVWYRDDLRISDHPALSAAARHTRRLCSVYVLDDKAPGIRPLGGAARWWLAQSLRALQASLRERGASLVLRKGSASEIIPALARETGAEAVYWNEIAQAPHRAVEDQVAAALTDTDIAAHRFPGDLLASPSQIRNKENRGLRVFTPFWRRVLALGDPPKPLPRAEDVEGRG